MRAANRHSKHPLPRRRIAGRLTAAALLGLVAFPTAAGSLCGNARLDPGETCDDGNQEFGDGCSRLCQVEPGYTCTDPWVALGANELEDGGFEAGPGNPFWSEESQAFGTPICKVESCPEGAGARKGAFWTRFFTNPDGDEPFVKQDVVIPPNSNVLRFDLQLASCGNRQDTLVVLMDENELLTIAATDPDCGQTSYQSREIYLDTAPGGPYDDGQAHSLLFLAQINPGADEVTNFGLDNVVIARPIDDPQPSVCTLDSLTLFLADFDPPTGGDLEPLGFSQVLLGELELPWGTTDDGFCGSGDIGAGNFTGGNGEAACIDSNAAGPGVVESYLCTDLLDLSDSLLTSLMLSLNYQPGDPLTSADFFGIFVGDVPPDPGTIGGYEPIFFTNEAYGEFGAPPGVDLRFDLSVYDGLPELYICFGYGGDMSFYAQMDGINIGSEECTDDFDADKLEGCVDNCESVPNPLQTDSDGDGYGNACDADIAIAGGPVRNPILGNGNDCQVNFGDLAALKAAFLSDPTQGNWNPDADLNEDLLVNFGDLARMKEQFLGIPGPSGLTTACGVRGGT